MAYHAPYEFADSAVALLTAHPSLSAYAPTRVEEFPDGVRERTIGSATAGEVWVRGIEGTPELAGIATGGVPDYVRFVEIEVLVLASRKMPSATVRTAKQAVEEALLGVTLADADEPLTLVDGWSERSDEFGDTYQAWMWSAETEYDDTRATVGYSAGNTIDMETGVILTTESGSDLLLEAA